MQLQADLKRAECLPKEFRDRRNHDIFVIFCTFAVFENVVFRHEVWFLENVIKGIPYASEVVQITTSFEMPLYQYRVVQVYEYIDSDGASSRRLLIRKLGFGPVSFLCTCSTMNHTNGKGIANRCDHLHS